MSSEVAEVCVFILDRVDSIYVPHDRKKKCGGLSISEMQMYQEVSPSTYNVAIRRINSNVDNNAEIVVSCKGFIM